MGAEANANLDIKGWVWTLAGQYWVIARPDFDMNVLAGARMIDMEQKLSFELTGNVGSIPLSGRSGTREVDATNWDGIIGVNGRYSFGKAIDSLRFSGPEIGVNFRW